MTPTILVVDDEPHIADLLAEALGDEGYRVRRAYDGLAALAAADEADPDVVVTDVMMPGLDGVDLARRLRERGVPVVLMSAARTTVDLPGVRFVPKPFDLDEMLAAVSRALRPTGT